MKKGAIFDMDGLLFDTETVYQRGWTVIADEFGVERKPELGKACCGTCGDLTRRLVHEYHPTVDADAYVRRVIEYVKSSCTSAHAVFVWRRRVVRPVSRLNGI